MAFAQRLSLVHHEIVRARAVAEQMADLAERAAGEVARLRASLAESPAMARLAARVSMTQVQRELVWAIVACSIDARSMPHLEAIGGGHARRGLSVAVYAQFASLADETAAQLSQWLAAANPLLTLSLIEAAETGISPAARAYVASPRLVAYLRGDEFAIQQIGVKVLVGLPAPSQERDRAAEPDRSAAREESERPGAERRSVHARLRAEEVKAQLVAGLVLVACGTGAPPRVENRVEAPAAHPLDYTRPFVASDRPEPEVTRSDAKAATTDLAMARRLCDTTDVCFQLGKLLEERGDKLGARDAYERDCEYRRSEPVCKLLSERYLANELPEPIPGRGAKLRAWVCSTNHACSGVEDI